jgi:hypothetical protein
MILLVSLTIITYIHPISLTVIKYHLEMELVIS